MRPEDWEGLGREIVGKCRGLPLAIVVIGGILSRKEQEQGEWEQQIDELMPEEVGEVYLKELVGRSLIQVTRLSWEGRIKSCRIHDLSRDVSIARAREEKFLEVHLGKNQFARHPCLDGYRSLQGLTRVVIGKWVLGGLGELVNHRKL
ncbi:hypothetical protein ACLOJK_030352 [Asimina triloba]